MNLALFCYCALVAKMMFFKQLVFIFLFFIFFFAQTSFLPGFNIISPVPNLVFILFFLIIFFEEKKIRIHSFFPELAAGFFLGIPPVSFFVLPVILLSVIHFLKETMDYFLEKTQGKYAIFNFIFLFSVCFVLYNALMGGISLLLIFQFNFGLHIFQNLIFNVIFAIVGFYIWKTIINYGGKNRQLKLFN